MARTKHKLTAAVIKAKKAPGLYAYGDGLFLQVTQGVDGQPRHSRLVRFTAPSGKLGEMGLGAVGQAELAKAREKAAEARELARDGVGPIEHRKAEKKRLAEEAARAITFKAAATMYIDTHEGSWKNAKYCQQWRNSLETYAYPVFGDLPIQAIDVELVMKVLDLIWKEKTETATCVRGRIETILDWATVRGYRSGENPARWRGHLQWALPAPTKLKKIEHHSALPYGELAGFMKDLAKHEGIGARLM